MKTTKYTLTELKLVCRRRISIESSKPIRTATDAASIFYRFFPKEDIAMKEYFKVMLLDQARNFIGVVQIAEGGLSNTAVDVRNIMQAALLANAAGIILAHNHPSGSMRPSAEDVMLTERVEYCAKQFNLCIIDHLIIGMDKYYSFTMDGMLKVG